MNIHNPSVNLRKALDRLKRDPLVLQNNKNLILEFTDSLLADGLSESRVIKYVYTLKKISKLLGIDFLAIDKKAATRFFKDINIKDDMAEWTKHDYKLVFKRFYKWIGEEQKGLSDDLKVAIDYISSQHIKRAKSKKKLPEHLLTTEEVMKLADNTTCSRDKAFTLTLYESACRIGEIIPIKIKDVEFDKYGVKINVTGKTGFRPVRICVAAPAISNWLTNHPDRNNPDAYLFCGIGRTNYKQMLSYASARKIIFEAAEKAGIKKRVNLHKFRASRATQLVIEGMSEPLLCDFGGWVIGSDEIRTYVKLSGKNVANEILRINGLLEEEDQENSFKIIKCPRCGIKNSPGAKFCSGCSLSLDQKNLIEVEKDAKSVGFNIMELMKDPTFVVQFGNQLAEQYERYRKENNE